MRAHESKRMSLIKRRCADGGGDGGRRRPRSARRVTHIHTQTVAAAREVNYFLNENRRRRRRYDGQEEGMRARENRRRRSHVCAIDSLAAYRRRRRRPAATHRKLFFPTPTDRSSVNLPALQPPTPRSHGPATRARVPPPPPPRPSTRFTAAPLHTAQRRADEFRRRPRLRAPAHTPTGHGQLSPTEHGPPLPNATTYFTSTNLAGSRTYAVHILYVRSCQSRGR